MSRKPRPTAAFSLFTFLDVMLCTLGALIIVLICVVRTAQIKNSDTPPETLAEIEEIESARATAQWRAKHLAASRDQTRKQLQDRRLELSHIEEHTRRLRGQLAELETAEKALAADPAHKEKLAALRDEVQRFASMLAEAENDLRNARDKALSKRSAYAVVPYEGPNQTARRPLYIECRAGEIVLQPENIVLTPNDLSGPLGPDNPLAAGLRAAREYLMQSSSSNADEQGEPYPLLLVRPDGVIAYYVAQEAMTSWGSEFGYELVDQDWNLNFRASQPGMADAMRVAVDDARIRQRALARAAPRYFAEQKREWYRASSGGGVVRDGGPGDNSGAGGYGRHRRGQGSGNPSGTGGQFGYADDGRRGSGRGRPATGRAPTRAGTPDASEEDLVAIYGAAASGAAGNAAQGTRSSGSAAAAGGGVGNQTPGGVARGTSLSGSGTGGGPGTPSTFGSGYPDTTSAPSGMLAGGDTPGAGGPSTGTGTMPRGRYDSPAARQIGFGSGAPGGNGADGSDPSLSGAADAAGPLLVGPATSNGMSSNSAGLPGGTIDPARAAGAAGGGLAGNPAGGGAQYAQQNNAQQGGFPPGAGGYRDPQASVGGAGGGQGSANTFGGDGQGDDASSGAGTAGAATAGGAGARNANAGQLASQQGTAGAAQRNAQGGAQGKTQSGAQAKGNGAAQGNAPDNAAGGASGFAQNSGQPGARSAASGGQGASNPTSGTPLSMGNSSTSQASSSASASSSSVQIGTPSVSLGSPAPTATSSLADRRGKNWSLPEEARRAVPLTRPVRVECRSDKLLVRSEGSAQTREIPIRGTTEESIENLVSAVWQHVDTWGEAGRGMYWRPVLSVDVAPGADGRFADLQTLLADSGLEVKTAQKPATPVARPPRKTGLW